MRRRWIVALVLGGCAWAPRSEVGPAQASLERGIELVRSADFDSGIAVLRAALAAAPAGALPLRVEARRWIAHAFLCVNDPEAALAELALTSADAPDDPWLRYAIGRAWSMIGDYEHSLASYAEAIALDPGHVKAWQWKAEDLALVGRHAESVEASTRALELLETAEEPALAAWEGDRKELLRASLTARIRSYEALGDFEAAARDRARRESLASEP